MNHYGKVVENISSITGEEPGLPSRGYMWATCAFQFSQVRVGFFEEI
jgi:hypothetical protein